MSTFAKGFPYILHLQPAQEVHPIGHKGVGDQASQSNTRGGWSCFSNHPKVNGSCCCCLPFDHHSKLAWGVVEVIIFMSNYAEILK